MGRYDRPPIPPNKRNGNNFPFRKKERNKGMKTTLFNKKHSIMLPKEFSKRQHEFQSEPVLFFIPTSIDDGSEVVQSYSRQECIDACIQAVPLSHFAELWNDGSVEETPPDVRYTWCCVSMPTVYDACQGEKKREINLSELRFITEQIPQKTKH
jgi:hypothetical protein